MALFKESIDTEGLFADCCNELYDVMTDVIKNDKAHRLVLPGYPDVGSSREVLKNHWTVASNVMILLDQLQFPDLAHGCLTSGAAHEL